MLRRHSLATWLELQPKTGAHYPAQITQSLKEQEELVQLTCSFVKSVSPICHSLDIPLNILRMLMQAYASKGCVAWCSIASFAQIAGPITLGHALYDKSGDLVWVVKASD